MSAVLAVGALSAYVVAYRVANRAFDTALLNSALALEKRVRAEAGRIVVELPSEAQQVLQTDRYDSIHFQVRNAKGEVVAGSMEMLAPPAGPVEDRRLYYNSHLGHQPVRVVALFSETDGHVVQIAETLTKRGAMVREVLLSMVVPEAALALLALVAVWFTVGHGLAPLIRLRDEIATRSDVDLHPIAESVAPTEVLPVVHSLNGLLARLGAALEAQRRFIANAAHQLRTPLAALQTQAEAAAQETDPVRRGDALNRLRDATRRTARLANQMLALARAEPGGGPREPFRPVRLDDLAREGAEAWVARAVELELDLGFDLEPALVSGDPLQLRELIANLADNALRYTPRGGRITLRTTAADGRVSFEVDNDGASIPEEERQRVFERFYRLRGSPGDGCGLGLAIVSEIARAHGAQAEAMVPSSGTGTRVRVLFLCNSAGAVRQDGSGGPAT